ncbi:MAG: hypothetical protein C5B57_04845 [Blastocatellia bacterium]|nr:MAG: hypothetical protein C5B57_04845 [Blastocatellia bacterium]
MHLLVQGNGIAFDRPIVNDHAATGEAPDDAASPKGRSPGSPQPNVAPAEIPSPPRKILQERGIFDAGPADQPRECS